jgi:hypothetical protein
VGAKRYLKREQTHGQTPGQTDRQTDISTYRKHRPRGPMHWKSKIMIFSWKYRQNFLYIRKLLSMNFSEGFRISKNIGHPTSGSGGKKTVKRYLKSEKSEREKKLRDDLRQFSNKNVHIWDHFFPLLFPKDSESLKILDIWFREVGAKRYLKSEHTDRHTDRRTFWLIASIGPEGRCFEN